MKQAWILLVLGVTLLTGPASAQPAVIVLDPLIDWKNPKSLTLQKVDAFYQAQPFSQTGHWRSSKALSATHELIRLEGEKEGLVVFTIALGTMQAKSATLMFDEELGFARLDLTPDPAAYGGNDWTGHLVNSIQKWIGGEPADLTREEKDSTWDPQNPQVRKTTPYKLTVDQYRWQRSGYSLQLTRRSAASWKTDWAFAVVMSFTGPRSSPPAGQSPEVANESRQSAPPELKADLDPLLDFSTIWQTHAEQFEKRYIARKQDEQQKEPPQFEWLTVAKDRARFSRQMFVDAPTTLTLFGGAVKVEEAVVEFVKGKAGRATISIYNRGDAGQMGNPEFQALFKKVGQSLGSALKVAPRRQMSTGTGAVKNVVWMWTSPLGVALLEHNDFESQGGSGKPEYLRLKVAAPDQADWTMGRMSLGVQRMSLQKNVTRDAAGGDIFIGGVPMVDQGAKGYCVAASCQRLLEYMHIPCDQHEMAQLLNVDVERGANAFDMQKSLAKVDQKFGVAFKPLVNPEQYYGTGGKRRVSLKEFTSIIKEHADKGVPLLWALGLGQFPEDPPLPNGGQVSGGHMRMIIGYNATKNQVIFTDSWGAGHEKKRMKAMDAYEATLGLYSMSPRGL
ncbi:C39 family peptidase [Brevifollis gellanilyticus]|uniref:Peptidase C39-like domain-containing protein n=1 Tax=Brevifollis gellanilyticus TaxID=748831 RepID=A0A512MB49_9BACT|nr:C39 family peptidase [Brevifollis gellanilyticus]GEP43965.1 hypothetical protein BGE01nite_32560 [Brevifollis gellanilyticus]